MTTPVFMEPGTDSAKVEAAGIERETDFAAIDDGVIACDSVPTLSAANVLHGSDTTSRLLTSDDATSPHLVPPEVRFLADAWPHLAPHIREAIQTLVTACLQTEGGES